MAFRLIQQNGVVAQPPMFVKVYASGVISAGEAVDFDRTNNRVIPASSSSTYTTIFGVALDTVRGASDTLVRVVPFVQGQLWGADVANTPTTAMLMIKHPLSSRSTLANSSYDQTTATGIFLAYGILKTILIGEFIRAPIGWVEGARVGYF